MAEQHQQAEVVSLEHETSARFSIRIRGCWSRMGGEHVRRMLPGPAGRSYDGMKATAGLPPVVAWAVG